MHTAAAAAAGAYTSEQHGSNSPDPRARSGLQHCGSGWQAGRGATAKPAAVLGAAFPQGTASARLPVWFARAVLGSVSGLMTTHPNHRLGMHAGACYHGSGAARMEGWMLGGAGQTKRCSRLLAVLQRSEQEALQTYQINLELPRQDR